MIKSCNTSKDVEFKTNSGYTGRVCLKKNKKQNMCAHEHIHTHTLEIHRILETTGI